MGIDAWMLLAFITGICGGGLVAWLWERAHQSALLTNLRVQVAELNKERESDIDKQRWLDTAQHQMRDAFQSLASQSLQSNSDEFIKRAREQVEPLQQNLRQMDAQIRELEKTRAGAYQGLQQQLTHLLHTHSQLQTTTTTLAQALRSPTVRGRWGEMQLRRVVEMAGLRNHVDFEEQQTIDNARPDMIIKLPGRGIVPVDAKAPMTSFMESVEATDDVTRKARLAEHVRALNGRVRELAKKTYWQQFDQSPEIVIMFVPSEACLCAAFDSDPRLLETALEQRVFIATPVTLLALLKGVAYGWQQHDVTESIRHIADEGREMYGRLGTFVGHLSVVGERLDQAVDSYNKAVGSLEGRVLPTARRFRELGLGADVIGSPPIIEHQARLPGLAAFEDTVPNAELSTRD